LEDVVEGEPHGETETGKKKGWYLDGVQHEPMNSSLAKNFSPVEHKIAQSTSK
jgi:hypothetical protein